MGKLADIRLKVAELGGAHLVAEGVASAPSDELLAEIEQQHGISIPPETAEFIQEFGGSTFDALVDYPCGACQNRHTIAAFYGDSRKKGLSLAWALETYRTRLPRDLLPIAGDGMGNQICIALGGANAGTVFWWDHHNEQDDPESLKNLHSIANSLEEWVGNLSPMAD